MHIDFLVEEPSAEAALNNILPKILGGIITYNIIVHQGKKDLLKKLPNRLRGYAKWIDDKYKIVVLLDKDSQDCIALKAALNQTALNAGLKLKIADAAPGYKYQVLNRIAIEELESWFFGDQIALKKSYPRIPDGEIRSRKYSNPDGITQCWETLEQLLQKGGYYPSGLPKIENARKVSKHMDIENNSSHSFNIFKKGLQELISE